MEDLDNNFNDLINYSPGFHTDFLPKSDLSFTTGLRDEEALKSHQVAAATSPTCSSADASSETHATSGDSQTPTPSSAIPTIEQVAGVDEQDRQGAVDGRTEVSHDVLYALFHRDVIDRANAEAHTNVTALPSPAQILSSLSRPRLPPQSSGLSGQYFRGLASSAAMTNAHLSSSPSKTEASHNVDSNIIAACANPANLDFWNQHVTLFIPEYQCECNGTYEELHEQSPLLQGFIQHRHREWNQHRFSEHQSLAQQQIDVPQAHLPQDNTQSLVPNFVQGGNVAQHAGNAVALQQNPAVATFPSTAAISTTPVAATAQPPPLLVAVRGSGEHFQCKRCEGDGVRKGRNDGIECTRCFNKTNTERGFALQQAGYGAQGQQLPTAAGPAAASACQGPATSVGITGHLPPPQVAAADAQNAIDPTLRSSPDTSQPAGFPRLLSNNVVQSTLPSPEQDWLPPDDEVEPGPYDPEHETVEAALEYLRRPPAHLCKRPQIENDDWETVKNEMFTYYSAKLYNALQHPGASAPWYFTDNEKEYHEENQEKALKSISRDLKIAEQITVAKARVMVALDEIIAVHETGVPKSVIKRAEQKTNRGYVPEMEYTCSKRIKQVIHRVASNKYISQDVLRGSNLAELARAPKSYHQRKLDNCQTNAKRSEELKNIKDLRNGEKTADEITKQGKSKRGQKAKADGKQKMTAFPTRAPTRMGTPSAVPMYGMSQPNFGVANPFHQTSTYPGIETPTTGPYYNLPATTGKRRLKETEDELCDGGYAQKRKKYTRRPHPQDEADEADADFELEDEDQAVEGGEHKEDGVVDPDWLRLNGFVDED